MDFLLQIMAILAILGLFDELIGGKLGIAPAFGKGLATMGRIALSMAGL